MALGRWPLWAWLTGLTALHGFIAFRDVLTIKGSRVLFPFGGVRRTGDASPTVPVSVPQSFALGNKKVSLSWGRDDARLGEEAQAQAQGEGEGQGFASEAEVLAAAGELYQGRFVEVRVCWS
jgi:hypothetical protein